MKFILSSLALVFVFFVCFVQADSLSATTTTTGAAQICPEVLPGRNRLTLFQKREFSTSTDPYVPPYPYGGIAYGPFVDINGFSPVDTFGNHYAAYPSPPDNANSSQILATVLGQVRVCQGDLVREFASGSLVWQDTWMSVNVGVLYTDVAPNIHSYAIDAIGHYASQVKLRPTLTTLAEGPLSPGSISNLYVLIVPKAFDTKHAAIATSTYGCTMPRYTVSSPDCPLIANGQYSQGRVDWNRFRTSDIFPLHPSGNITKDLQQEFKCIKSLLDQAGGTFSKVAVVRVNIRSLDPADENEFINAYKTEVNAFGKWKPALFVTKGGRLLNQLATISVSIEEALIGNPSDTLVSFNNEDVFSLPDLYNQVVQTPAGWSYTSQMFPSINRIDQPLQLTSNGPDFYASLNPIPDAFKAALHFFKPTEDTMGSIWADWVAQTVQILTNTASALAYAGVDLTDVTYQYNVQGPPGLILPLLSIADGVAIVFNGTQGRSGFSLPVRDETVIVSPPFFGGAGVGDAAVYGAVIASRFVAFDYQNFKAPANNNGAVPGVTSYLMCDGSTDFVGCPTSLRIDLGAEYQPVSTFYP